MLVCLGCIQEGDDSVRVACASDARCSRCGSKPEPVTVLGVFHSTVPLHTLFRVNVLPAMSFDGGGTTP
jgi:hypothetical protein